MGQVLCSTGALIGRPNNRNYKLLESLSEKLSCDGYEFMMYDTWYSKADEIACYLQNIGLFTPVMHCEKHIGEIASRNETDEALRLFTINCKIAEKIHAKNLYCTFGMI
ncbi:MAG: hypothetical protein K1W24_07315 [Lachnospiraceae bacterium]